MRTVGKRKPANGWMAFDAIQKLVNDLVPNKDRTPRGVYRFKSHKEAQEWLENKAARPRIRC